jgi:hypothetical protein
MRAGVTDHVLSLEEIRRVGGLMLTKHFPETRLFHNAIGRMPRDNLMIYWEVSVRQRAIPHLVIALTLSNNLTVVRPQNSLNFRAVVRHRSRVHSHAFVFVVMDHKLAAAL